jgi:6-phosphogluconolactonase (cycloisomerase 2 family)
VSSFSDGADGTLTPVGAPVANDGGAACWIEISHDGSFLFVVNTASASISSYAIGAGGTLTFLQSTAPGEIGAGAEDARLSPDGSTLWVVESGTDAVTGFTVDGGTLTPLAQTAGPLGAKPSGIVVN